ncbi:MAG: nucleotidyltransferase domain-containing protein [Candidatus Pacearchaeota archaeon]|jgi:predicted nucleotidyltransferase
MELIRNVQRWGNSSGVLLPKEWLNREVKIVLVERSLNINQEIFDILSLYLDDIIGIYITGSYARGEQDDRSDIDIIAISNSVKKEINSGIYNVSIIPLDTIEKTIKNNPIMILPRLYEAKAITNVQLLNRLKEVKLNKNSFKDFIKDSERIIEINRGLIQLDKELKYLESSDLIYSLVLRLRGIYLIRCILDNQQYSNKDFLNLIKKSIGEDYAMVYNVYRDIKEDKKSKYQILVKSAQKLLDLLKEEVVNAKKYSRG